MQLLRLVRREPDKAYIDRMLWLPKTGISVSSVKAALQYFVVRKSLPVAENLWQETEHHLIVPREFLKTEQYPEFSFPFVDLIPHTYPEHGIRAKVTLDPRRGQIAAFAAFEKARCGVLNLAPGKGKTVLACKKIEQLGGPCLIIVHNTYLLEQWKERIAQFIEFPPGEQLGIIQGPEFDWKHPVTLAMIQSLAAKVDGNEIPAEFDRHFCAVIYDEVHHLSAPFFVKTATLLAGQRFGLTATPLRGDGLEFIYSYHLGQVFYSDMTSELTPRVYFQDTPSCLNLETEEAGKDKNGDVHIGRLRGALALDPEIIRFREFCIREALKEGRKVLAIGHSKDLLVALHEKFPDAGIIIQATPQKERTAIIQNNRLTFAIAQLGMEGLDDDFIDAVFFLTPFKSENDLIQTLGRLQRIHEGKKTPVAIVFDDINIDPLHFLCNRLRGVMNKCQIVHQTLKVPGGFV